MTRNEVKNLVSSKDLYQVGYCEAYYLLRNNFQKGRL